MMMRLRTVILFSVTVILFSVISVQAEYLVIEPVEDTYIDSDYPDDNFVETEELIAALWDYPPVNEEVIALLKFDLSKIPSNIRINSAEIQLYAVAWLANTPKIGVFEYPDNIWEPTTVTWNTFDFNIAFNILDVKSILNGSHFYSWNVTKSIQNRFQEGQLSLALKAIYGVQDFRSINYYNKSMHPKLYINYSIAASLMEGDVNLNNHVTIADAQLISKYKAGLIVLTPDQIKAADTNDDGSVTVTDALFIAKWLANPNFPLWDPIKDSDMLKPVP